jgi:hypothetical protein
MPIRVLVNDSSIGVNGGKLGVYGFWHRVLRPGLVISERPFAPPPVHRPFLRNTKDGRIGQSIRYANQGPRQSRRLENGQ